MRNLFGPIQSVERNAFQPHIMRLKLCIVIRAAMTTRSREISFRLLFMYPSLRRGFYSPAGCEAVCSNSTNVVNQKNRSQKEIANYTQYKCLTPTAINIHSFQKYTVALGPYPSQSQSTFLHLPGGIQSGETSLSPPPCNPWYNITKYKKVRISQPIY
ncbi:hypothetical protein BDD12DRAFT_166584 [Trichophaea hybrida]|nr:hypothetical protein BDD12DRAFT_166584 [Trichophaea hybrida]